MTRLSVIMPTYNRLATLRTVLPRAIELARNFPVDFLIVDDGSTDGTADYLRQSTLEWSNVQFESIANAGPGNARNLAASKASGDLLLFMGDDTWPVSSDFYATHFKLHEAHPDPSLAVLGKLIWPRRSGYPVSFAMSLIQGEGGQQFGYAQMRPYAKYDWRFFYTANVSIKKSCVADWSTEGFSPDFKSAAYEDGELAYRLMKKMGRFDVLYAPTSLAEHDHPHSVETFINRQTAAGMMANVFASKHPEATASLGLTDLFANLRKPAEPQDDMNQPDMLAVIEGVFASARVLERTAQLSSSAWHTAFVNATFELAYLKGAVWGYPDPSANRSAAYRLALDRFDSRLAVAMEFEHLASVSPWSYQKKK